MKNTKSSMMTFYYTHLFPYAFNVRYLLIVASSTNFTFTSTSAYILNLLPCSILVSITSHFFKSAESIFTQCMSFDMTQNCIFFSFRYLSSLFGFPCISTLPLRYNYLFSYNFSAFFRKS